MLATFYQMFMNLLTMLACTFLPIANRALVQIERFDDGLNWTSVRQQGDHLHHHLRRMSQTIEDRAPADRKRLSTHFAYTPFVLLTMNLDVVFSFLSSCGTIQVRAK